MENSSPYYLLAHDFALFTNRSIFLTGKAGSGKTTFLHKLRNETKKQVAIVAPTGVAAINAGGTTMHSFFQLPLTPFIPTAEGRKNLIEKMKMQGNRRKVLQELELLVIDEISMVRADVLDSVDTILRHVRFRNNEPFGGVQVIFIGDMFQLSPVASDDEWRMLSQYYSSPYFFHSQVVIQQQPIYIELDKIFRQSNADFIKILNEVRNNCLSESSLKLLQSKYTPAFTPPVNDTYITLTTHNYKADQMNAGELAKINGKTYTFEAEINGDYPEKSYPTEKKLVLKIGAKVMFLKNDTETPRRYYNGKIGVIEDIDDENINIKCPGEHEVIELSRCVWENIRYTTNPTTKQIEEEELGKFTQYPLRLAWAITIHKSQGLTFDKAVIDAGAAFAAGQVYVALSRCRSLDGIVLLSKINPQSIQNDRQIVEHTRNKLPLEELEKQLTESRNLYRNFILLQLYDFKGLVGLAARLLKDVHKVESSFNDETIPFLENIVNQAQTLQEVSDKFQNQLQNILNQHPISEEYLQERLDAACDFYTEKAGILMETLRQSPAISDSRANASEYNEAIKMIFSNIAQKNHLMKKLKHKFSVEDYFILKNTFFLPDFSVNAYAKTNTKHQLTTRNPELYKLLMQIRNEICEPSNLPIYLVAGSQTLIEMSDYLPQNETELLAINGFGPAKVEKYGRQFLDVIVSYSQKHGLQSMIQEKKDLKKEKTKREKKPVGETYRISLAMYKANKSIEEIATSRNLTQSTIIGHLERYVKSGELDINEFVSAEKRQKATTLLKDLPQESSVFEILSTFMNYAEVKMYLAWIRNNN